MIAMDTSTSTSVNAGRWGGQRIGRAPRGGSRDRKLYGRQRARQQDGRPWKAARPRAAGFCRSTSSLRNRPRTNRQPSRDRLEVLSHGDGEVIEVWRSHRGKDVREHDLSREDGLPYAK